MEVAENLYIMTSRDTAALAKVLKVSKSKKVLKVRKPPKVLKDPKTPDG